MSTILDSYPVLKPRPSRGSTDLDPAHVMSAEAVATALGITVPEVYRIERRAIIKLRRMLWDQGLTLEDFMVEPDGPFQRHPFLEVPR